VGQVLISYHVQSCKYCLSAQCDRHLALKTTYLHGIPHFPKKFSPDRQLQVYNIHPFWNSPGCFVVFRIKYNFGMSDFYTRTGDGGTSGLLGNERLPKDHPRLEAIGAVDEANAAFGLARASSERSKTKEIILDIQRDLYNLMAEIAATPENAARFRTIDKNRVQWLEDQVEFFSRKFKMPKDFIIPGDARAGASLDLARTIVRRAERRVSSLYHDGELENQELLRYLNRLSSLCFVLELWETITSSKGPISLSKDKSK
jgi:cob(I)alamin adenosyltransferase